MEQETKNLEEIIINKANKDKITVSYKMVFLRTWWTTGP